MTTTTTTTALADLDLDKLEALARSFCADCVTIEMSMNPSDVLQLVAIARRAAQPVAPVQIESTGRRVFDDPHGRVAARYPIAPSPQVAEGEELPPLPEPDGSASVPVDESRATFTEVDAWSEELVRQAQRDAIAASRRAAGGEALVSPDEWAALCRFRECCDDFDSGGHDVDKAMMRRLERIGVVRSTGFGRHEMTDFGNWLHDHKEAPAPASAGQAAPALVEQYDGPWPTVEMTVAGKRMLEKQTSIEHIKKYSAGIANSIYEAMQAASPVGIAAQPVEGAGQAGQVAVCSRCEADIAGVSGKCGVCWNKVAPTERAAAPAEHKHSFAADGYCLDCDAKEPQPEKKGSK